MFALWEPKLNCWDILLTVYNSVHLCMCLCGVRCTACHECIGVQSGKVQEWVLIISFLLFYWTPNVRLESLRPGLIIASPCLRVITAFTTQSNLPDLSFFCPTLITSLQGFYDHFLSYSSPLCFTGNSIELKYLQAVVSNI